MKPICVPCQRFFRPQKNCVEFVEAMQVDGARLPPPGTEAPEQWKPYKLWEGDRWACEGCGAVIIVGVAPAPIVEHYQPGFAERARNAELQVNDC